MIIRRKRLIFISAFVILLFLVLPTIAIWSNTYYICNSRGPRKDILEIFPNAEIYQAQSFEFMPGGFRQLLMPEGYLLPGVMANVLVKDAVEYVNIKNLALLGDKVDVLTLDNCKIIDWEEFIMNPYDNPTVILIDPTFIGGDDKTRMILEKFRKVDSVIGKDLYIFQ